MLGLGMDLPLMQWLYNYTFRTEAMFKDTGFAREVYSVLARELIARGTTHVCAFSSVHTDASLVLAEELERRLEDCDKPITVAVMGCVVHGPGEARAADVGIAGGDGEGLLFRHGEILRKVPQDKLVDALMDEIDKL